MKPTDINLIPPSEAPSPQVAFNVFPGQWVYQIPVPGTETGQRETFYRLPKSVQLLRHHFPEHAALSVMEMGPHEGENTFHLHHLPVARIHAVEGRTINYLKCLLVKNELRLDRAYFALGDAVALLRGDMHFDLTFCCGILYHLPDPLTALRLIAEKSDRLVMTTAVFDENEMRLADERTAKEPFPTNWLRDVETRPEMADFEGLKIALHRRTFRDAGATQLQGHGGVNTACARLLTADGLRAVIAALGGEVLHFKSVVYPRAPEVECVVRFR
jgi:hypothetical protein